jgi:phage recombination protein Bet
MSTAMATTSGSSLPAAAVQFDRERIDLIKKTVCPQGISDAAFALFIEQCKRSGLDPLIKQAFCVMRKARVGQGDNTKWVEKYEFQPSEAGMLARAEQFPDFRGVTAAAVCENDECSIDAGAGEVFHKFGIAKRGRLLGAWARLQREGRTPIVVWLDLDAYVQDTHMWKKLGPTMIAKCARVAVLRGAYPSAFGGLYIADEMPAETVVAEPAAQERSADRTYTMRSAQQGASPAAASAPTPPAPQGQTVEAEIVEEPAASAPTPTPDAPLPGDDQGAEWVKALRAAAKESPQALVKVAQAGRKKHAKGTPVGDLIGRTYKELSAALDAQGAAAAAAGPAAGAGGAA